MPEPEYKVVFEPSGRKIFALSGTILLEAAARAGIIIQTPCGGAGTCGKCRVRVTSGDCPASEACTSALGPLVAEGYRLACQAKIRGDLTVEIPKSSLFETQQQILTAGTSGKVKVARSVHKHFVRLRRPDTEKWDSDAALLQKHIGKVDIELDMLRELPGKLRKNGFTGTAVVAGRTLIDFEPGDTSEKCFGVAFDLGTTTIVGALIDLASGEEAAIEAEVNPQTSYGDDLISRLRLCREHPDGLNMLRKSVLNTVNNMIAALAERAGVHSRSIYAAVCAGNTVMQEIFCGIDPSPLGEIPFAPACRSLLRARASDLGLDIHPRAEAHVFPQIGGFVGGDTAAGVLACRLASHEAPAMLVDIGTNGEIVLAHNGRLCAASVAAGPAFEGARISCGMRAGPGAIEKILFDSDVRLNVIANTRPAGMCGSALIDAAAELLRVGLLEESGRILAPEAAAGLAPARITNRLVRRNGQTDFMLAPAEDAAGGEALFLTQKDIRELQLANAAIRAGINILLAREGLTPDRLETVFVAGAFGNFIRRNHAKRIGLLPDVPSHRIQFIGNASLQGAKQALISVKEREYAAETAAKIEHVDLSASPEFQQEFAAAMLFPKPNTEGESPCRTYA